MASIKMYVYGAIAVALIGLGVYVRGVFADRASLRVQVATLNQSLAQETVDIAGRDAVIVKMKSIADANNATISSLEAETTAMVAARNDAQKRLEASQEAYARLQQAHQTPLPAGCEAAVRTTAARMGAHS